MAHQTTKDAGKLEQEARQFLAKGDLHIADLEVSVTEQGELTIKGRAPNYESKRAAEDAAERVPGVVKVRNEIRVPPGPPKEH